MAHLVTPGPVDHGLRASWLHEPILLTPEALDERPELGSIAGHLAESAFGATAAGMPGLALSHQPERGEAPEVDLVFTIGDQRLPVAVKYQFHIDPMRHTGGLRSFIAKSANLAPFRLLIIQSNTPPRDAPGILNIPLATFMLLTRTRRLVLIRDDRSRAPFRRAKQDHVLVWEARNCYEPDATPTIMRMDAEPMHRAIAAVSSRTSSPGDINLVQ